MKIKIFKDYRPNSKTRMKISAKTTKTQRMFLKRQKSKFNNV